MQTPRPAPDAPALDADALHGVLRQLEDAGDAVGVVRLVDRWSHEGSPSRLARMAEARALIALCLMDRAWARLRELSVEAPDDPEALLLTAEMFLQRGWQARARRMVERMGELHPDHPALSALRDRAGAAAPAATPELAAGATRAERLDAARRFLSAGKVIRARGILEQLLRESPRDGQIRGLLWAVRGDTQTRDISLKQLVEELLAGLAGGGWEGVEHTELSLLADDPETAEASKVLSSLGRDAAAFPSLFRADEGIRTSFLGEEDDVTVAAVMASAEELAEPPTADVTDPDVFDLSGVEAGDTQIMQVINRPDGSVSATPLEVRPTDDARSQPLDLRALERDQAAADDTLPGAGDDFDDDDYEGDLDEDDDLVVMRTRSPAASRAAAPPPAPAQGPMNVIERVPVPDPVPDIPGEDEDTPPVSPSPVRGAPPAPMARPVFDDEPDDTAGDDRRLMPLVVGAAVLAVAVTLLAAFGVRGILASQRQEAVESAVLDGDSDGLRRARAELQAELEGGAAANAKAAAWLVVVDALLLAQWEGDLSLEAEARKLVDAGAVGKGLDAERARLHLLWAQDELAQLQASASPAAQADPAVRLVLAEAALRADDAETGRALVPTGDEAGLRAEILRARAAGGSPRSGALAALHPLGVLARAADASLDESLRLGELAQLRSRLPAEDRRMRARAWATEARLHERAGRREAARDAWEKARQADPNDPVVLEGGAASVARDGKASLAQGRLERCLELRPRRPGCQRGLVQVLLLDDKVRDAVALTDGWREAALDMGLLGAWVDLHARTRVGRARSLAESWVAKPADGPLATPGLATYLVGFAEPDGARSADTLGQAERLLDSSDIEWDRMLVTRAAALAAERQGG